MTLCNKGFIPKNHHAFYLAMIVNIDLQDINSVYWSRIQGEKDIRTSEVLYKHQLPSGTK